MTMRGKKNRLVLERRVAAWDSMPAMGQAGNTKYVRRHDGSGTVAYHRPGSQNGRK